MFIFSKYCQNLCESIIIAISGNILKEMRFSEDIIAKGLEMKNTAAKGPQSHMYM